MPRPARSLCLLTTAVLAIACNTKPAPEGNADSGAQQPPSDDTKGGPGTVETPETPEPDPFAIGPGKQPVPLTAAQIDAPIPTEPPPLDFWKRGDQACDPGSRLDGAAPPNGKEIRCIDANGRWTGMEARFHDIDGEHLQQIGRKEDGRMVGVWLWFHPSGAKAGEHTYVDGELHGTMRRWAENGQEIEQGEYRAGRPWGLFVQHDEAGKELGRAQLDRGTGLLVLATISRRTESEYVDGKLHGRHRELDANGVVTGESYWSGGDMHGTETYWAPDGRKISEGQWKQGQQHGNFLRWKDGQLTEQSIWIDGTQRSRQLVRDGQPLAPLPKSTTCDDDAGLSNYLASARGRGLPDDHACVTRMPLFPGVIMLGDFAYDRGCMATDWVVDCKLTTPGPSAADLLARAGWARATGEQRIELATEYMREFGLAYSGSISWTPDEPQWKLRDDQGVEAVLWIAEPAGMRRGVDMDKVRLVFGPDGSLQREVLEHRSTDD